MNIVFVSNYYNHHQHWLCSALARRNPGGFHFIATSEMRQDRKALGYGGWEIPGYVRTAHTGEADLQACRRLIEEADVVIAGAAPENLLTKRIRSGKLTFRYLERPWKKKLPAVKYLPKYIQLHMQNPGNKPIYLLCAGAYTASDYARFGLFRNKAYRWGYFPEVRHYETAGEKDPAAILWVGRFLDWKHPELAVETAERLKKAGYHFTLDMIGMGPMESQIREQISRRGLADCVRLLGAMKPGEVRAHMERAGIFLFTSDRQEGWGAVLNESMNSSCAVVASHAIGSVPYLTEDGINGLIFRSCDGDMLYEKVKLLLDNPQMQKNLGLRAYETVTEIWNGEMAAERLCVLAEHILAGEKTPDLWESGPCSRAEQIDENWY